MMNALVHDPSNVSEELIDARLESTSRPGAAEAMKRFAEGNRFLAFELYEESFAHRLTRAKWKDFVYRSKGLGTFREVMFRRMVPNLREIGLLSDRVRPHYEAAGLGVYFQGAAADRLTAQMILDDLDPGAN